MDHRHSLWWTMSTLLSPSLGSWWTERRAALPISPPFLCFSHSSLHAGGERPVSLASDAGAQSMRVKAPPSLGVFVGGVNMACGVPWCAGHGGGLPGTTAASVWWLRPRRGVSVGCVSFYGYVGMRRGRPGLKAGLRVSMWPVGAPRRPRRHGDDSEARGSTTGLRWGSHSMVTDVRMGTSVPRGWRWPWPTRSWCGAPWPTR